MTPSSKLYAVVDVDEEIRKLYAGPLDEFVKGRDALVKDLKDKGQKERAAEVKAFKRPTVSAWAVNQLSHQQSSKIEQLAAVVSEMEAKVSASKLRELMDERRRLISQLTADAEKILSSSPHGAAPQTLSQVTQTLTAATSGDDLETLKRGTFSRPLEASGFGDAFLDLDEEDEEPQPSKEEERLRAEVETVEQELNARRQELSDASGEESRLRAELEAAEKRVASASAAVDRLEGKLEKMSRKLEE